MLQGYVKLYRSLLATPIFANEKLLKVWLWCLLKASHSEHIQLVGLQKVSLAPGQFITGRYAGAAELKMKPSTFWGYMLWLQENQSIDIISDKKKSLVTVVNWASYQVERQDSDNKTDNRPTSGRQPADTNNNVKNAKNEKKKDIYTAAFKEKFWPAYPNKVAEDDALKAWLKIKPDDELVETILRSLERHKKSAQWLDDDGKFIPKPANWLSGGRWKDEVKPKYDYSKMLF